MLSTITVTFHIKLKTSLVLYKTITFPITLLPCLVLYNTITFHRTLTSGLALYSYRFNRTITSGVFLYSYSNITQNANTWPYSVQYRSILQALTPCIALCIYLTIPLNTTPGLALYFTIIFHRTLTPSLVLYSIVIRHRTLQDLLCTVSVNFNRTPTPGDAPYSCRNNPQKTKTWPYDVHYRNISQNPNTWTCSVQLKKYTT